MGSFCSINQNISRFFFYGVSFSCIAIENSDDETRTDRLMRAFPGSAREALYCVIVPSVGCGEVPPRAGTCTKRSVCNGGIAPVVHHSGGPWLNGRCFRRARMQVMAQGE